MQTPNWITTLPVPMLVLPASVRATLQEWGQQRWSDEVRQQLEHHPFGAETSVLQHPKNPAQACTVMRHSLHGHASMRAAQSLVEKGCQSRRVAMTHPYPELLLACCTIHMQ